MNALAGVEVRDWLDQAAVMGVVEVLKHYGWFKRQFEELLAEIVALRPPVLLLVDYPGFNFRFAAAVRKALPDTKIIQYVCPQVWAWKKGRIPKMVELFDEVLCLLPFRGRDFRRNGAEGDLRGAPAGGRVGGGAAAGRSRAGSGGADAGQSRAGDPQAFPMMLEAAGRLRAGDRYAPFPRARPPPRGCAG